MIMRMGTERLRKSTWTIFVLREYMSVVCTGMENALMVKKTMYKTVVGGGVRADHK